MFRGQELAKPNKQSILFTVIISIIVFVGSQASPVVGYFSGLIGLLVMIVASFMESFWPTRSKPENSFVFSLFWGIMIGGILPFTLDIFLEGGFNAVYEMLLS